MSWKIKNKTVKYSIGPCALYEIDAENPNGGITKRISLYMGGDTVMVIPKTEDGLYLVCKQSRVGVDKETIEFPNGGIKKGEEPIEAAKRELAEECGLTGNLSYIGEFMPLIGIVDMKVIVFACNNVRKAGFTAEADDYEKITTHKISEKEFRGKCLSGEIFSASTITAFSLYNAKTQAENEKTLLKIAQEKRNDGWSK